MSPPTTSDTNVYFSRMTTSERRREVRRIIIQLHECSKRPLFEEFSIGNSINDNSNAATTASAVVSTDDNSHHTNVNDGDGNDRKPSSSTTTTIIAKRRRRDDGVMVTSRKRRWEEIISRASSLLPFMTNDEHGIASRYVTALLLGYLIPNGTGGPFDASTPRPTIPSRRRRRQQQQSQRGHYHQTARQSSKQSPHNAMTVPLQQQQQQQRRRPSSSSLRPPFISLAEYLETSTPCHSSQRYDNGLVDETYRSNFYRFLTSGLSLFLSRRPAFAGGGGGRNRWDGGGNGDDNHHHHHGNDCEDCDDEEEEEDDVDLLRVLSAVICPSASSLSLHGYYFFANVDDACMMTKVVADCLTLPTMNEMTTATMSTTDDDDDDDDMTMDHDGIRRRQQQQQERRGRRRKGNALFDVALPSLRRSLQGFLKGARGVRMTTTMGGGGGGYLAARTALMRIAVQTRCKEWVNEALDELLVDLVGDDDDGNGCVVRCDCCDEELLLETEATRGYGGGCCVVRDVGGLLEELICKYCISSYHADDSFVDRTSQRLARVIENCLNRKTNDVTICQLSSLLNAAKSLFYFFSSETTNNENNNDTVHDNDDTTTTTKKTTTTTTTSKSDKTTSHPRESLIQSAVQLLCHHHPLIVRQSSLLLELALAYNGVYYGGGRSDDDASANYAPSIFAKLKHACYNNRRTITARTSTSATKRTTTSQNDTTATTTTTCRLVRALHPLVACLSRQSPRFADATMRVALKLQSSSSSSGDDDGDLFLTAAIFRLASSCSLSQPDIVYRHIDALEDVFCDFEGLTTKGNGGDDDIISSSIVSHFIVVHLSFNLAMMRQPTNNNNKNDDDTSRIYKLIDQYISDPWILFKLARVSLITSRFDIAQFIYERKLLPLCSTPRYTTWLTILSLVSRAEGQLCHRGAEALVDAMSLLHSARFYLRSMMDRNNKDGCCSFFQIHTISLRIDFLSLCATARSLASEMVLLPHDDDHHQHHRRHHPPTTRSQLFKSRLPDNFDALSRRYWNLYRMHGLSRCQKTKGSLRALSRLARCFSRLTEAVFNPSEGSSGGKGGSISAAAAAGGGGKHGNSGKKSLGRKRKVLSPLWPRGDVRHHPLMSFVERLEETVLKSLTGADEDEDDVGGSSTSHNNGVVVEPETRACLLREVLDAVLKRNGFFPVGFLVVEGLPPATMILSADPMDVSVATEQSSSAANVTGEATDTAATTTATAAAAASVAGETMMGERNDGDDDDIAEVLEAVPGLSCRIYASGKIPSFYFRRAKPCLSQVIAWCYVTYDGPLDGGDRRDEELTTATPTTTAMPEPSSYDDPNATTTTATEGISLIPSRTVMEPTASGPILPGGRFYLPIECMPMETEGYYKVVIELGCRDVRGSEWVIPTGENDGVVFIRVSSDQQSRRGGGGGDGHNGGGERMKERRGSGSVVSGKDEESCAMVLE